MEYSTYRRFWGDEKADRFAVIPQQGASIGSVRENLQSDFDARGIPAEVLTRDEVIGDVREISEGLISIARGIQLAALIVAALTIANTMFIAVLERRWEFGLQRAMGMSRRDLGLSVLVESGSIGVIGAVGGLIMGTAFGLLMLLMMEEQFFWRVPFEPQWALMALGVSGGVAIAAGAGIYPRRIATSVPIVECLRYE
jgi:putative ABC transport system permease protein